MRTELYIVGTSGFARECAHLARRMDPDGSRWSELFYVSHDPAQVGLQLAFGQVSRLDSELANYAHVVDAVIGIGHPHARNRLARVLLRNHCIQFPTLIHPSVEIASGTKTGMGNFFAKGVVASCDVAIGDFNLMNWNVTIGHDVQIGDCNVINPGASVSGAVVLGDRCLVGTGARILENLAIASDVVIGAGSVVTKSIDTAGTYVGVPARRVEK